MSKHLYKIVFFNNDTVCEIYAEKFSESDNYGFVEVESIVFGENSSVVVDPSEERLKHEFSDVKRSFIPIHSIIRIDEVAKQGTAKVTDIKSAAAKVSSFPFTSKRKPDDI